MKKATFEEALLQLAEENPQYDPHVYGFMREALDFTIKALDKPAEGPGRHVTGRELTDGIRQFALKEFGPITKTVLNHWGIHTTEDFGNIVFLLISKGIFGKSDEDSIGDFAGGYDFDQAFRKPFLPSERRPAAQEVEQKELF